MRLVRKKSRSSEPVEKLSLEKVIGLTSANANGLACNPATGDIAYLAGCVVVVFHISTKQQTKFLTASRTPKALSCVAYSPHGGKLIAAGECGHQPAVLVWDSSDASCIAELKGHKYGVSCVQFSPNGKYLLSVGFPHDGQICVFDYKLGVLLSKAKATTGSSPVHEIQFSSDGSFFVTAGGIHLKYWTLGRNAGHLKPSQGTGMNALECRNINLGSLRESSFVSVSSVDVNEVSAAKEIQLIYVLTAEGILCLLHQGLAIKKWVNLKVRQGHSLCVSRSHVACACSDGIVRVFITESLAYGTTLPRPAPVGFHDLTHASTAAYLSSNNVIGITYPDAVACRFAMPTVIAVLYSDHSFFVWDTKEFSKVLKIYSFLPHSGCIWDVANIPSGAEVVSFSDRCRGENDQMDAFATCSADGSIRLWHLFPQSNVEAVTDDDCANPRNVYDQNICGVLYQEKRAESEISTAFPKNADLMDSSKGFRSISVSPDGHYLAAGDRSGNLYVYDVQSLQAVSLKEAHDAEILTLSFGSIRVATDDNEAVDVLLLASGGRDRLVHIYDSRRNFEVIETVDDHSASVTAAKFAWNGSKFLSASADKSVVFRNIESKSESFKSLRYHQEMASRGTVYDMDVDPSRKLAVTVSQDKRINFLSLANGKFVKCFRTDGDSGEPIKVRIDPTGTCLACSHSDKTLRLYDITNGSLLSSGQGHAEVITGVVFMHDCKRLVSVSGDSCIFVWKLPSLVSKLMRKRSSSCSESTAFAVSNQASELHVKQAPMSEILERNDAVTTAENADLSVGKPRLMFTDGISSIPPAFKFSVSRLPHWAQAKVSEAGVVEDDDGLGEGSVHSSGSKWVERLGSEGYKLFCEPQTLTPPATVLPAKFGLRRRFTIEQDALGTSMCDTPESSAGSHISANSTSTPLSVRKENDWKTVHTLFFDEEESAGDDVLSEMQFIRQRNERDICNPNNNLPEEEEAEICRMKEDHVTYDSVDKHNLHLLTSKMKTIQKGFSQLYHDAVAPLACMVNSRSDGPLSLYFKSPSQCDSRNEAESLLETVKDNINNQLHREHVQLPSEDISDDESDQYFNVDGDLFNDHFGNLSTLVKTDGKTTRSSFSAQFFLQSNCKLPVSSLIHDYHLEENVDMRVKLVEFEIMSCSDAEPMGTDGQLHHLQQNSGSEQVVQQLETAEFGSVTEEISLGVKDNTRLQESDEHDEPLAHLTSETLVSSCQIQSVTHSFCPDRVEEEEKHKTIAGEEQVSINGQKQSDAASLADVQHDGHPSFMMLGEEQVSIDGQTQCNAASLADIQRDGQEKTSLQAACAAADLFQKALHDLSEAADNALTTFIELDSASKIEAFNLFEQLLCPTLRKVQQLSESMSSVQSSSYDVSTCNDTPKEVDQISCSDHSSLRLSNPASISFPLESFNVEGFIQDYSLRFSEVIASRVLELVGKSLGSKE